MRFPRMVLVVVELRRTPAIKFPEMMFPAPGALPPIVRLTGPRVSIPAKLPSAKVPLASVPMKFPWIKVPVTSR